MGRPIQALVSAARSAMASSSRQTPASPEPGKRTSTRWQSRSIVAAIEAGVEAAVAHSYASPGPQSHAAPRTPLESPCTGGFSTVSTRSEKAHACQSRGTLS